MAARCPKRISGLFSILVQDSASFEIKYLNDGGAYGNDYHKTLAHVANAGKYKSEKARAYYIRKGMTDMLRERARCNSLDSRTTRLVNAQWERTRHEFGKLYQWGRGGRTLAPNDLIKQGGGSLFSIREDALDEFSISNCVDAIQILESFNAYVESWCEWVPELWREHYEELRAEANEANAREIEESRPDMYPQA
jgi:hypothetical protein